MITKVVVSPNNERANKILTDLSARKDEVRKKVEKKLIDKKIIAGK